MSGNPPPRPNSPRMVQTARKIEASAIEDTLKAIQNDLHHHLDEKGSATRWERKWRRREVVGLWAAAAVGVGAIFYSSHDTEEQISALKATNAAYLKAQDFSLSPNREDFYTIHINFKNSGKSTAEAAHIRGVVETWVIDPRKTDNPLPSRPDRCDMQDLGQIPDVGPDEIMDAHPDIQIAVDKREAVTSGRLRYSIRGCFEYISLGVKIETPFCEMTGPPNEPNTPISAIKFFTCPIPVTAEKTRK